MDMDADDFRLMQKKIEKVLRACTHNCGTVVFKKRQNPKTYEKQKAERFYILFLAVRVYLIVQELSTMIVRKIL